ncbi:MAG: PEPxxWA-CTERM sorting domain-containing protein [Pseudomonadota bacterium]
MKTSHRLAGVLAAGAALFTAMPALAVSVVAAKRIEITSAIPTWMQIAEVQAFAWGTLTNVAASANGGTATATSFGYGGEPGGAIDGVVPVGYVGPDAFHSGSPNAGEKLTITFATATDLASLKIFGVMDGGDARNLFNYRVLNARGDVLASGELDSRVVSPAEVTFDAPPVTTGVPEPSAWALMILGFGAAGSLLRRRAALA